MPPRASRDTPTPTPLYISSAEAARMLGITRESLRHLLSVNSGPVKAMKLKPGAPIRVNLASLLEHVARCEDEYAAGKAS